MIYWTVFLSALVIAAPALAHNPDDLGKAAAASVVTVLVILVMFHAGALRVFRGGADSFRMNYKLSVDVFESGVLYRDGVFERLLPPGEHWIKPKGARLLRVDMRPQVFQIAQGVMTADRTRAVLRSVVRVQIKDARAAVESATDYRAELFAQIQSAIKKQAAS